MLFLCKVSACIYTCSVCYLCVIFKMCDTFEK
uniref:Uncharacterized protein n=1 Tax=Anguilla anguilla TaxID=7936 RepID=A0A0E9VBK1_ANGAN